MPAFSIKIFILIASFYLKTYAKTNGNEFKTGLEYNLESLLKKDFKDLTADNSNLFKVLSNKKFNDLFYDGLEQSILFLNRSGTRTVLKTYKTGIKNSLSYLKKHKHLHLCFKSKSRLKHLSGKKSALAYSTFADFRGKWYGKWEGSNVVQYWLSPKYVKKLISFSGNSIRIISFQTVNIGDGIGWNYQVEIDNKSYVLGYTCHFSNQGKIYLKRPHVGIVQPNNGIIWITKDHIYFEFICKSSKCDNLPLHYVISGVNFEKKEEKFRIIKGFQTMYLEYKEPIKLN